MSSSRTYCLVCLGLPNLAEQTGTMQGMGISYQSARQFCAKPLEHGSRIRCPFSTMNRGPKDRLNLRILHFGDKAQATADSKNHALKDPYAFRSCTIHHMPCTLYHKALWALVKGFTGLGQHVPSFRVLLLDGPRQGEGGVGNEFQSRPSKHSLCWLILPRFQTALTLRVWHSGSCCSWRWTANIDDPP